MHMYLILCHTISKLLYKCNFENIKIETNVSYHKKSVFTEETDIIMSDIGRLSKQTMLFFILRKAL